MNFHQLLLLRQHQMTKKLPKHKETRSKSLYCVNYSWKNLLCCQRNETHHFLLQYCLSSLQQGSFLKCGKGDARSPTVEACRSTGHQINKLKKHFWIYKAFKNFTCLRQRYRNKIFMDVKQRIKVAQLLLELAGTQLQLHKKNASMCNCIISITSYMIDTGIQG